MGDSTSGQHTPQQLTVKVYYVENGENKEIRKFSLDEQMMTSYKHLMEKIKLYFTTLAEKALELFWKDGDNDLILVSSDEELLELLKTVPCNTECLKLFIKEKTVSTPAPECEPHPGVLCDECDKNVVGLRYICTVCPNFDLCEACEKKGSHPIDHDMLCVKKPRASSSSSASTKSFISISTSLNGQPFETFTSNMGQPFNHSPPPSMFTHPQPPIHPFPFNGIPPLKFTGFSGGRTFAPCSFPSQTQSQTQTSSTSTGNASTSASTSTSTANGGVDNMAAHFAQHMSSTMINNPELLGEYIKNSSVCQHFANRHQAATPSGVNPTTSGVNSTQAERDVAYKDLHMIDEKVQKQQQQQQQKSSTVHSFPSTSGPIIIDDTVVVVGAEESGSVKCHTSNLQDDPVTSGYVCVDKVVVTNDVDDEGKTYDKKLEEAVRHMERMGFDNNNGWLRQLLISKDLDIGRVVDALRPPQP